MDRLIIKQSQKHGTSQTAKDLAVISVLHTVMSHLDMKPAALATKLPSPTEQHAYGVRAEQLFNWIAALSEAVFPITEILV